MKNTVLIIMTFFLILSCQKDDDASPIDAEKDIFNTDAGKDILDIEQFKVVLDAKGLSDNEIGTWTIISGLVDSKVQFVDINDPKTIFYGLPGEEYKLVWTSTNKGKTATDTVSISFVPLKTEIINVSPEFYKTRLHLQAKMYDRGKWTIQGDYNHIYNQISGGITIPNNDESPNVKFYGFENKNYILTWTTWYGSKSASVSMNFTSTNYSQDEALEDLTILNDLYSYKKNADNNVVEINMGADDRAWNLGRLDLHPALQSLKYLKKLNLSGDLFTVFPEVIASKYLDLEVLSFGGNAISSLPENFGNLTKLDTLLLDNNQFGNVLSTLPDSFGKLKNLRYLILTGMGINSLPESFSNLTNLNYLDIDNNVINKLPENFGNLKKLETFRGPMIVADLPSSFSNLANLKFCFFKMRYDSATYLPTDFGKLKKLETLWLFGNYEYLPTSFASLTKLKDLEISAGSNLKNLPANFGDLTNLAKVTIVGNLTTLPKSFTELINLTELQIRGKLNYLPDDIGKLKKLHYLLVNDVNLQELPKSIGDLDGLYQLSAYKNNISTIPDSFGELKKIERINLSYNSISVFPDNLANLSNTVWEFEVRGNSYSENELNHLKNMFPLISIK